MGWEYRYTVQEWNSFCLCFEFIGLAGKWPRYTINIYLPPTFVGDFLLSDKYSPKNAKVACLTQVELLKILVYCRSNLTNILKSWRSLVKSFPQYSSDLQLFFIRTDQPADMEKKRGCLLQIFASCLVITEVAEDSCFFTADLKLIS